MDDNRIMQIAVEMYHPKGGRFETAFGYDLLQFARRLLAAVDAERCSGPSVEKLADVIHKQLTSVYICTRVWEAWNVGTMTESDFVPAGESTFADELAEELMSLYAAPQPTRDPAPLVEALRKLSCLGNGGRPGNSDGNMIAREALAAWEAKP